MNNPTLLIAFCSLFIANCSLFQKSLQDLNIQIYSLFNFRHIDKFVRGVTTGTIARPQF